MDDKNLDTLQRAQAAFFNELAKAHPEIKTGDVSPEYLNNFNHATLGMYRHWLDTNTK